MSTSLKVPGSLHCRLKVIEKKRKTLRCLTGVLPWSLCHKGVGCHHLMMSPDCNVVSCPKISLPITKGA